MFIKMSVAAAVMSVAATALPAMAAAIDRTVQLAG
jgi:hypothetical protein